MMIITAISIIMTKTLVMLITMMIFHATAICGGDDSYANKYNNDDNEGHDHDDIKGEEDKEDEENDEDDHVSNPPLPHDLSNTSRSTHPSSTPYARYQGLRAYTPADRFSSLSSR